MVTMTRWRVVSMITRSPSTRQCYHSLFRSLSWLLSTCGQYRYFVQLDVATFSVPACRCRRQWLTRHATSRPRPATDRRLITITHPFSVISHPRPETGGVSCVVCDVSSPTCDWGSSHSKLVTASLETWRHLRSLAIGRRETVVPNS